METISKQFDFGENAGLEFPVPNLSRAQLDSPLDAESEGALKNSLERIVPELITRSRTQRDALVTDLDAATITFNLATAGIHTVTLGGNRTLALTGEQVGQIFTIRLIQDGSGNRTVTWFSTLKWAGGSAPTLTTTAGKADTFVFLVTSLGNYDGYIVGQNI